MMSQSILRSARAQIRATNPRLVRFASTVPPIYRPRKFGMADSQLGYLCTIIPIWGAALGGFLYWPMGFHKAYSLYNGAEA